MIWVVLYNGKVMGTGLHISDREDEFQALVRDMVRNLANGDVLEIRRVDGATVDVEMESDDG